eukprot:3110545-Amphidinium_carterae.1
MLRSSPTPKEYIVGEAVYFWTPGARRGARLVPDADGEDLPIRPASIREQRAAELIKSERALQQELAPGQPAAAMDISAPVPPVSETAEPAERVPDEI